LATTNASLIWNIANLLRGPVCDRRDVPGYGSSGLRRLWEEQCRLGQQGALRRRSRQRSAGDERIGRFVVKLGGSSELRQLAVTQHGKTVTLGDRFDVVVGEWVLGVR
jgi:hypothetical protein